MPNLMLLCHGGLIEDGAFSLSDGQCVQYRGNYGSLLSGSVARSLVQALHSDPYVSDEEIRRSIPNYQPQPPLDGPNTFRPNIALAGDDNLMCFLENLKTRQWARLGSGWKTRLGDLLRQMPAGPCWINLLCCTLLPNASVPAGLVDPSTQVNDWTQLMR